LPRNNDQMRLDAQLADERRCTVFGVKGTSALAGLEYFDMVWGLSVDYMHNVWVGVVKDIIETGQGSGRF